MGFAIVSRCLFDGITFGFVLLFTWAAITNPGVDGIVAAGPFVILGVPALLIALGGGISYFLYKSNIKTLGQLIYAPAHLRVPGPPESLHKTFWGIQLIVTLLLCLAMGAVVTDANPMRLFFDVNQDDPFIPLKGAFRLFYQLSHPDLGVLSRAIMSMIETIFVAFLATATAVPVAFFLAFFTARNIMGVSLIGKVFCVALRLLFNITRSIEPILWAIIYSVWVGIGPFAGMLALMVHAIASLAKQYSEFVESVEDGPIEGIRATGAGTVQTVWFAIVPQVVLPFISFTIYRWDINVRMATILGLVGGGGIGKMLIEYQGQAQWHQVGTIIVVISFVVWVMDAFSAHVRAAIK